MTLANKVQQLNADADTLHLVVHGSATQTVNTEGGPVPTVAKVLKDAQDSIGAQGALGTQLAAAGGAGLVGTTGGGTVQSAITSLGNIVQALGANRTTDQVTEASNLYFTESRVRSALLVGLSLAVNAAVSAADTVLTAIGKLQAQVTSKLAAASGTASNLTIQGYTEQYQALPSAAVVSPAFTSGTFIEITVSQNMTVNLPLAAAGSGCTVVLRYTGAFVATFAGPSGQPIIWANGNVVPTPTSANGKRDKYVFTYLPGNVLGQDGGRPF